MKLNIRQEKFISLILEGYTRKSAYMLTHPDCRSKSLGNIYSESTQLFYKPNVQERYKELKQALEQEMQDRAIWTREQAISELKELLHKNRMESDRYEQAYNDEMEMLDRQIVAKEEELKNPKGYQSKKLKQSLQDDIDNLKMARIMCNRRHQSNKNVNDAILQSIMQLNEMLGYNKQEEKKVEVQAQVVFTDDVPEEDDEEN